MANKRMFTMKIVDSDSFLDMPLSTQCLYFHLNMRADDDGFVGNPKRIQKLVGASEDDLKLLIGKRFILTFEDGVIVIKHWRMHNTLSQSRYHETQYIEEKSMLRLKDNGSYSLSSGQEINDKKLIDSSLRQSRRTKDEQETHSGLDLGLDLDLDLNKEVGVEREKINYQQIADMYNNTCVSFPSLKSLSDARRKAIRARLKQYSIEQIQEVFIKAESSSFLKGANNRNWAANFDWMIKDSNLAKILDGNYDDSKKSEKQAPKKNQFNNFPQRNYSGTEMSDIEKKLLEKQWGETDV